MHSSSKQVIFACRGASAADTKDRFKLAPGMSFSCGRPYRGIAAMSCPVDVVMDTLIESRYLRDLVAKIHAHQYEAPA